MSITYGDQQGYILVPLYVSLGFHLIIVLLSYNGEFI